MSLKLKVYDNGDHTCLVWLPADGKPIPNCRGFAIRRVMKGQETYLHGFVGFSDKDKLDPKNPWKFPVQRFMWWDYGVQPGNTVQYSVVPVVGPSADKIAPDPANASPLTPPMTITGQCTPNLSAYFNKGVVAAQWVSRALDQSPKNSKIKTLVATPGNPLRNALSGLLRPQILALLEETKKNNGKIYAALYELNDPELIPGLTAFGKDCNLILANGAFKGNTPPDNDENAAVRAQLKSKINVFDRIVSSPHFGHNKFVVFCDSAGNPQKVLTGSTNWTTSGLCTQANNGLIINDASVAKDFLAGWQRIKAAGNGYPPELVDGNSVSQTLPVDGCSVTPWFVKTSAAQDLAYARKLISDAQEGILFLFFNPGTFQTDPNKWTLLQNILERHNPDNKTDYNPDLYMCGVVNQDISNLTKLDPTAGNPVTLYKSGADAPQSLSHDVLVPHNIKTQFADWEKELLGASMVNIHSKVIVLDPFGAKPVVMTGSHNLGLKASSENDDNLVIIEGNAPLAAAYAINIVAIFQTYRWNSYVEAHRKDPHVWHGLVDNDQWQTGYLQGRSLDELQFWMGEKTGAPAKAVAAAVGGAAVAPAPVPAPAPAHPVKSVSVQGKPAAKTAKAPVVVKRAIAKKAPAKKAAPKKPAVKKAPTSATKKAAAKKSTRKPRK
jgi:phosphatidylserine/phosphatidylglycerophosphate/cardiolipin synthase-like enzyme